MKYIKLTQNKFALVDDGNFEFLNQWKWYFNGGYAVRGYPKRILMHRVILNSPNGMEIDHKNRNKLDNSKNHSRSFLVILTQFIDN